MQSYRKPYRERLFGEDYRAVTHDDAESGGEPSLPMLEALVCETHSTALLTATIASAVNAFKAPNSEKSESALRPFVPREPALIAVLRNGMLDIDIDEDSIAVITDFFDDLAPARIALDQYFADASHIGPERASALHLLALSSSWRRSCELALVAARQLHGYLGQLPSQYTSNSKLLIEILQEAILGASPCLDPEGRIAIPDLPQRRRTARRTLCEPCTITHNRITSEAFVRDVSPGGFGLERVSAHLAPKSLVLIELPSGRRFTGVIAWCNGTSAGVRFSRTLLPNDPLLSG